MNLNKIQAIPRLLGLLLVFSLGACANNFPSENSDPVKNNKAAYNKDLKECQEDYPELASGQHIRQWINCMKLKGWQ